MPGNIRCRVRPGAKPRDARANNYTRAESIYKKWIDPNEWIRMNLGARLRTSARRCSTIGAMKTRVAGMRAAGLEAITEHGALMLDVLKKFRVIYGAVNRQFRVVERKHGLSGAQAWLVCELAGAPSLGVTDLAARLSVHQSTVSQLIEKLVRSGHVERASHAMDRRRVRLRLTRRGKTLARRLPRPREGVLPKALDQLPDASLRSLRITLAQLIAHMQMRRARDGSSPMG